MRSERIPAIPDKTREMWAGAALVLAAHGSSRGGVREPVLEIAAAIARRNLFAETAVGFMSRPPNLAQALAGTMAAAVYVVPFFLAHGHFSRTVIPETLARLERDPDRRIRYCAPIGTSPRLAEIVRRRVMAACRQRYLDAAGVSVLLIGHGTPRNSESSVVARELAADLASRRWFARVGTAFLEEAPSVADGLAALDMNGGAPVVAVGLFAAEGLHGAEDVPKLLDDGNRTGRAVHYAGAIGAGPGVAGLILERVLAFDSAVAG